MVSRASLPEEERKEIEKVVARVEALQRVEDIRIGCLLLQQKELVKECSYNGISNCAVCNQKFSLLRRSSSCNYCKKAVCKKCRTKTKLTDRSRQSVFCCKVCFEKQELWCKSGAWVAVKRPLDWVTMEHPQVAVPDQELMMLKEQLELSKMPPSKQESEDCTVTELPVNVPLLEGEILLFMKTYSGKYLLVLSNYRLLVTQEEGFYSLPLGLVEEVEHQNSKDLVLLCKNAKTVRLTLDSAKQCKTWVARIRHAIKTPHRFEDTFAFIHNVYCAELPSLQGIEDETMPESEALLISEYCRLGLDKEPWRITKCNSNNQLCSSYPRKFVVPKSVSDSNLQKLASHKTHGRIPAIVWWNQEKGAVIARCCQPMVGFWHRRYTEDERLLLKALLEASVPPTTSTDQPYDLQPPNQDGNMDEPINSNGTQDTGCAHLLIVFDLQSSTAVTGSQGGEQGSKQQDHQTNYVILNKGFPDIHSVSKSLVALRTLRIGTTDRISFLSAIENTQWLHYISQLLATSKEVAEENVKRGRSVLVYCSNGWESTPQVVSLAQLLLDPYYRTIEGFQVLVEKEWISFGHKFTHFDGKGDQSPTFLQWLDCVHQLAMQFPTSFEFNSIYLVKLAHHCYSQLFGTFLDNRDKDGENNQLLSVWPFLENYVNVLYSRTEVILYPKCDLRSMFLWHDLYCAESLIPYDTGHLDGDGMQTIKDSIQQKVEEMLARHKQERTELEKQIAMLRQQLAMQGKQFVKAVEETESTISQVKVLFQSPAVDDLTCTPAHLLSRGIFALEVINRLTNAALLYTSSNDSSKLVGALAFLPQFSQSISEVMIQGVIAATMVSAEDGQKLTQSSCMVGDKSLELLRVLKEDIVCSDQAFVTRNALQSTIKSLIKKVIESLIQSPTKQVAKRPLSPIISYRPLAKRYPCSRSMIKKKQDHWFEELIAIAKGFGHGTYSFIETACMVLPRRESLKNSTTTSKDFAASIFQLEAAPEVKASPGIEKPEGLNASSLSVSETTGPVVASAQTRTEMKSENSRTDCSTMTCSQVKHLESVLKVLWLSVQDNHILLSLRGISNHFLLGRPSIQMEVHKWGMGPIARGYSLGDETYSVSGLQFCASLPCTSSELLRRVYMQSFVTAGNPTNLSKLPNRHSLSLETILSCGLGLSMRLQNANIRMDYVVPLKAQESDRAKLQLRVGLDIL